MSDTLPKLIKEMTAYREHYYCGSDIGMFIGRVWVDDVISIQYTLNNNKTPVYGYMSEKFDGVARGSTVIEGQFAIAFREVKYFRKILQEYGKEQNYGDIAVGKLSRNLIDVYGEQDFDNLREAEEGETNKDEYGNNLPFAEDDTIITLQDDSKQPDRFGYSDLGYTNRVNYGFDIFITYGDPSEINREGTAVLITDCHITSQSMTMQPSGEPIAEIYTFFAKSIHDISEKYTYFSPELSKMVEDQNKVKQSALAENTEEQSRLRELAEQQVQPERTLEIVNDINELKEEFESYSGFKGAYMKQIDGVYGAYPDRLSSDTNPLNVADPEKQRKDMIINIQESFKTNVADQFVTDYNKLYNEHVEVYGVHPPGSKSDIGEAVINKTETGSKYKYYYKSDGSLVFYFDQLGNLYFNW